ncbi:MAG: hypothetical protein ACFFGZ_18775, partial [Candidatus Thorarchaeota archaeon]
RDFSYHEGVLILNLVSFFGEILASITGKPLMACSAFIRLALKDAGKDVKGAIITHKELQEVFKGPLKERLAALQLGDVQEIVAHMLLELKANHALLVMSA